MSLKTQAIRYMQIFGNMLFPSQETWGRVSQWPNGNDAYLQYAYPSILIACLSAFFGALLNSHEWNGLGIFGAVAYVGICEFLIVHTSVFAVRVLCQIFKIDADNSQIASFGVYAITPVYAVYMILPLLPDLFFLKFLYFVCIYTCYTDNSVIWIRRESPWGVFICGFLLSCMPFLIELLVKFLIPGIAP
ncbi:MAG: hypothetical protein J5808_02440 [Paludibacteraceae bacterium]|nr:hypothetical protein [Paludibacteraceae bacterium]